MRRRVASRDQLFVGVLANTFANQEGPVAMLICEWMQQCAGVNGRFVDTQGELHDRRATFDDSVPEHVSTAAVLSAFAPSRASADAAGDKLYKGVAEVLEAMDIMFAADVWGDIPYARGGRRQPDARSSRGRCRSMPTCSRCSTRRSPTSAAAAPARRGHDLVYGGNAAKWIEAAHTLKARIYLHQVEKLGTAQYTSALAEARKGISSTANDWKTAHSSATSERNMWAQFQNTSFGLDLVAGSVLVNIMKAQNDPRLRGLFREERAGRIRRVRRDTGNTPAAAISQIVGSGRTNDPTFRQPIITFDETQLIIAEAAFQTSDKRDGHDVR